jgi:hypothetical protein
MRSKVVFSDQVSLRKASGPVAEGIEPILPGILIAVLLTAPIIFPIKKGNNMVLKADREMNTNPPIKNFR